MANGIKNIELCKAGSSVDLCAELNYKNSDKQVLWKKKIYTQKEITNKKHLLRTLTDNGDLLINGNTCEYTFTKDDEGKYIKFSLSIGKTYIARINTK
jgi:hypothetical protein